MKEQTKDYFSNALKKALEETYNEILNPPPFPLVELKVINVAFDDWSPQKHTSIIEYGEALPVNKPNFVPCVNPPDEKSCFSFILPDENNPNPSHAPNLQTKTEPKCHFIGETNKDGQLQYTDRIPKLPHDFIKKYLKFVFDYEKNKDEAETFYLAKYYTMGNLITDLKFDIFIWVASELLFKKPLEYRKPEINAFFDFDKNDIFESRIGTQTETKIARQIIHNNDDEIPRMNFSNYKWNKFKKNRTNLTNRIKSFPMPPHLLYSYTDLNNAEKSLFLTDPLAYDKYNLINFLDFQNNIKKDINLVFSGILPKYSSLFGALVEFYLERVFNFDIVNTTIENIVKAPDKLPHNVNAIIKNTQLLKSDNVFTAKNDCSLFIDYSMISQAIELLFPCVAKRTLDNFTNEYQKEQANTHNNADKFTSIKEYYGLLDYLFNSYTQLIQDYDPLIHIQKEYDDVIDNFEKLTARERFEIFYLIANPYTHHKYKPSELLNDISTQMQYYYNFWR